MKKQWNVAIYARVSTDKKEQQESIPAQIDSLKLWLTSKKKHDKINIYKLIDIYEDQGSSGSSFQRDGFIRMREDIEEGLVNMVLTRDLSRFSRNYIMAGYYLEEYFELKRVRFVSVLDNVDTIEDYNDIIPFKNILNEMYIKDCSRRTKDGLKQRMLRGSCIASKAPYGYRLKTIYVDRLKHVELVVACDGTEKVVKEIFRLYLCGFGFQKIADYLNSKEINTPSNSKDKLWSNSTIRYILTNPKYSGVMAQHRWSKVNYKIDKVVEVPKEHWIIGGKYQGIIDKKTYDKVQTTIKSRKKTYRHKGIIHLFSSVLFCGECNSPMYYRQKYKGYKCKNSQSFSGLCTAHSVKEEVLLSEIKEKLTASIDNNVFWKLNKKNMSIEEINSAMLFENLSRQDIEQLVDKIIVHEEKNSNKKTVDIFLKFIIV